MCITGTKVCLSIIHLFWKIDYRQGKKETCNTFCAAINEDPMPIDLMSSLTLLVKLTFN
jgi:hypothetical protein